MEKIIKTSYHVDMEIYAATGNQHKKEELSHPFGQTDSIELDQRSLVDASKSNDQTSSILCSFKTFSNTL